MRRARNELFVSWESHDVFLDIIRCNPGLILSGLLRS
jgi:hypothetical protein